MPVPLRIMDIPPAPSLANLGKLMVKMFHWNACNFQLEFSRAILERKKHLLLQVAVAWGRRLVSGYHR